MPAVHAPLTPRGLFGARFRAPGRPRQKYPKMQNIFFTSGSAAEQEITEKSVCPANGVTAAPNKFAIQGGVPFGAERKMQPPYGPFGNQILSQRVCTGRRIFDY